MALTLLLAGPDAWSFEALGTIDHTSEYTTNSEKVEQNGTEEWIHAPGATIDVSHNTVSLDLDGGYRYQRRIYTDSDFDNEDVTTGSASVTWRAIPKRLEFFATNYRSESTEQAIGPNNPDNRQVVSDTSAGSNLRFQPRRGDEFALGYAYNVSVRDNSNDDSQSHEGTASYRVGLSETRNVTLLGVYSDRTYDGEGVEDATSTTVTLGYGEVRDDLSIDVSAGYSEFDRDNRDTVDGGVFNASITWRASGSTSLSLAADRAIDDQSSTFRDREDLDDVLPENSATNETFIETRGTLTWDQQFGNNGFSLSAFASKEDYQDVDEDNETIGVSASFSRSLTPSTTFDATASFQNRKFDQQDDEQDEIRADIQVNHRIGRRLSMNLASSYEDRDADNTDSYDEWTFSVGVSFVLLGRR